MFPRPAAVWSHGVSVQLLYGPTVSPYSCTVWSHGVPLQLLNGPVPVPYRGFTLIIITVDKPQPAKENVRQSRSPYSSCTMNTWDRTATVWGTQMIVKGLLDQSRLIQLL